LDTFHPFAGKSADIIPLLMKNPAPESLLKHGRALWEACALVAGVRLGVFEVLRGGPLDAAALGRKCRCSRRGMEALADALAAHGTLDFRRGCYLLSPLAKRYLLPGGETYLGDILLHQNVLLDGWARLDESVRTGRPMGRRPRTPEDAAAFTRAMASMAALTAPVLAKSLRLEGSLFLLDLGGGPGLHSLHFCRRNPRLHATVMDHPETLDETRRSLAPHPEITRIRLHPGDVLEDPLPGRVDVVWMSHLIHSMGEGEVRRLLRKAAKALLPGGRLIIHDFFTHEDRPGPPYPALFRLNMLRGTTAGRTYSRKELKRWMSQLGLGRFMDRDVPGNPSGLLIAVRP
jgi:SAM-dependent methyltransferase